MRSKAPLALMEQAVMLLVFALAAAFCLRIFAWADMTSAENAARDQALLQAQNAGEVLKSCRGNLSEAAGRFGGFVEDEGWIIHYSNDWEQTDGEGVYLLRIEVVESSSEYLGRADIRVTRNESEFVQWEIAWQEAVL